MGIENFDFYFSLFERGITTPLYKDIRYADSKNTLVLDQNPIANKGNTPTLCFVKNIPDYLTPNLQEGLTGITFFQYKGYAIFLDELEDTEHFLRLHHKTKFRTAVKRCVSRLESCFDITYTMYYGTIEKEVYTILMNRLKEMIQRRFDQVGETNNRIKEWNRFHESIYPLIMTNRASLFVIYDQNRPINISMNYHMDKILFNGISSYDIDYGKFGMGHVDVYKLLDWCIKNDYRIFDMSFGDLDYKARWSSHVYNFDRELIYSKNSLPSKIIAKAIIFKIRLKAYLKAKKVHVAFHKIKAILMGKKNTDEASLHSTDLSIPYQVEATEESYDFNTLRELDYRTPSHEVPKKILFDFLYLHTEHISNISLFELERDKTYLIRSTKNVQKITITPIHGNKK